MTPTHNININQQNTLYIHYCGLITHNNMNLLRNAIFEIAIKKTPNQPIIKCLYFAFSSSGGETSAGIEFYNYLRSLSGSFDIIMHNIGQIASIANVIFLSADTRYASKHSSFLLHGVTINLPTGKFTLSMLKEYCSHIEQEQEKISSIITERTGIKNKTMDKLFLEGEAKNLKFATEHKIINETREFCLPANALFINCNISNT